MKISIVPKYAEADKQGFTIYQHHYFKHLTRRKMCCIFKADLGKDVLKTGEGFGDFLLSPQLTEQSECKLAGRNNPAA